MIKRIVLAVVLAAASVAGCGPAMTDTTVTVDTGEISRPTVAISGDGAGDGAGVGAEDGAVYWAWIRKDDDGWNTYVARLGPVDSEPSAPVRVNHQPGNAAPHAQAPAQVAVRPDGGIVVAWTNRIDVEGRRFPASDLLVSVSEDGGRSFTRERPVHSDAGGPPTGHTFHDLAVLPDGAVLISWIDGRARDEARRRAEEGSEAAAAPAAGGDHAHGGGASPGHVNHEPGSEIRVARSDDGGHTFTETAIVDVHSCPCCRTALAVSPGGEVYLAWRHEFDDGDRDVVVASSADGGRTFSDPVLVHADGWNIDACPHAGPAITARRDGQVDVVWYTGAGADSGRGAGPGLYRATSTDGGATFGDRSPVVTDVPVRHAALDENRLAFESSAFGQITFAADDGTPSTEGSLPDVDVHGDVTAWAWQTDGTIQGRVLRPD